MQMRDIFISALNSVMENHRIIIERNTEVLNKGQENLCFLYEKIVKKRYNPYK